MKSEFIHSTKGETPILLEMPHSGRMGLSDLRNIPEILRTKLRLDLEAVRKTTGFGCDAAVPEMTGYYDLLASHGLSGLHNGLARVFTDTNRSKEEISGWALEGRDKNVHQSGVIWAKTVPIGVDLSLSSTGLTAIAEKESEPMFSSPLSEDEFTALMRETYDPYHAGIKEHHERIKAKSGYCIHLALHTGPAVAITMVNGGYICGKRARRGLFDPAKGTLPDVILIHNNFHSADKKYIDVVRKTFESAGLIVEDGSGPFTGEKGVTALYGDPEKGIHVIGIEHITHDIEPRRYLGDPVVEVKIASRLRPVYRRAIENLLS